MEAYVALPPWGQVFGPVDVSGAVHSLSACDGQTCAIHNPSHHMGDWPITLRMDYGWPLVERQCPHGTGHPDPDSVAWFESLGHEFVDGHGCDGCCREES